MTGILNFDSRTLLEDEVKERQQAEKTLDMALIKVEAFENASKSCHSVEVQTEDEMSRPVSRLSERFGAISPAVHVFDGPASHRIVPGGFRGCNYAAGMQQESLVRVGKIIHFETPKIIFFFKQRASCHFKA